MDQWLVRTASLRIEGPYHRDQLVGLIQEGKLGPQDEICQANQYWIFLHEQHEVQRQLGIQMPRAPRLNDQGEEEITETQTETESEIPPLGGSEMPEDYDGSTAVISRRPAREPVRAPPQRPLVSSTGGNANANGPSVLVRGHSVKIERQSFWRGLAWIMAAAAIFLIWFVLRLLGSAETV